MAEPGSSRRRSSRVHRISNHENCDESDDPQPDSKLKEKVSNSNVSDADTDIEDSSEPKRKKAKTKTTRLSAQRRAKLSSLPELPLDLLFYVFSLLSPRDLVNLTRANKLLRVTLLAPDAITVWRCAREATGAPAPLEDITEIGWCHIIFGGYYCQICSNKTQREIDWGIRKRLCKACLSRMVMNGNSANYNKQGFGVEKHNILPLVPSLKGGHSVNRQYLLEDVKQVVTEWKSRAALVATQGRASLDSWVNERREWVRKADEHSFACLLWIQNTRRAANRDKYEIAEARADELVKRLVALGHHEGDAARAVRASGEGRHSNKGVLTDRVWTRISIDLIAKVAVFKAEREEREIQKTKKDRLQTFSLLYRGYLHQFRPPVWVFLPEPEQVASWPAAQAAINAEPFTQPVSFDDVISNLPHELDAWKAKTRETILEGTRLVIQGEGDGSPADIVVGDDAVKLAASVYTRPGATPAISWNEITRLDSQMLGASMPLATFNPVLSEICMHLIRLAGMNPRIATPQIMDNIPDAYFICKLCSSNHSLVDFDEDWYDPDPIVSVLTWRETLHHHNLLHPHITQNLHNMYRAVEDDEYVEEHPAIAWGSFLQPGIDHTWTCSHCNAHLGTERAGAVSKADAIEHVKQEHNILEPQVNADYMQSQGVHSLEFNVNRTLAREEFFP